MQLIDGKRIASEIKSEIAIEVERLLALGCRAPHLAAILVGHDGASETYVSGKVKSCGEVGFKSTLVRYEDDVTESTLLNTVHDLNNNEDIDGFIVQLPFLIIFRNKKL